MTRGISLCSTRSSVLHRLPSIGQGFALRRKSTVSGRVHLSIPKGTSSGKTLRLKGKGVRTRPGVEPGDELVTVRIVMPDTIDESLSYFFSEWRQKHSYDPGRK